MGQLPSGQAHCGHCDRLVASYTVRGDRGFRPRAVRHFLGGPGRRRRILCPGSHCGARPPGMVQHRGAWYDPREIAPVPTRLIPAASPHTLRELLSNLSPRLTQDEHAAAHDLAAALAALRRAMPGQVGIVALLLAADAVYDDAMRWAGRTEVAKRG